MRELTKKEKELIDSDLSYLLRFCWNLGFDDTIYFKERFIEISTRIGDYKPDSKIKGHATYKNTSVELNEGIFNDDYLRRRVLFHEVGHLIFDYELMSQKEIKTLRDKQIEISKSVKSPNHYLDPNPNLTMAGYKLLHEYFAEKFSSVAANASIHQKPERKKLTGNICGENYPFVTTFDGNYGLIESVCDTFFSIYYSSSLDILKECLNDSFYLQLYDKFNETDTFRFLENLGRLYNVFESYHQDERMLPQESSIKVMEILNKIATEARLNDKIIIDREVAKTI